MGLERFLWQNKMVGARPYHSCPFCCTGLLVKLGDGAAAPFIFTLF